MTETNTLALHPSKDPRELLKAALPLARSAGARDQAALLAGLRSESYLGRLDPPEDVRRYSAQQLRLARILKLLLVNDSREARGTLAALTLAPTFQSADKREELLVKCLFVVRPAPPEVIAYWERHSTPDSIQLHYTMDALADNGTEPAIALLERRLADPDQDPDYKLAWIRDPVLRHRNDLAMLSACERMVRGGLPDELRPQLVDALCDYRREEWYLSDRAPVPPPRAQASAEAREVLRRICLYAKDQLELTPVQLAGIERALAEIGDEDEEAKPAS